jgi:DNA ligase (NAD+)
MDIEGLGEKIIDQLVDQELVQTPADLYRLSTEVLAPLFRAKNPGEESRAASNLVQAIAASREVRLERFLFALGIRHVGEEIARILARAYGDLDPIIGENWAKRLDQKLAVQKDNQRRRQRSEPLLVVPLEGIGPEIIGSIGDFFAQPHNLRVIDALRAGGVRWPVGIGTTDGWRNISDGVVEPEGERIKISSGACSGQTWVITGRLPSLSRDAAAERIRLAGGKVAGSVSKRTDFVLAGEEAGSKLDRARELGVPVMDEIEFLRRMLHG